MLGPVAVGTSLPPDAAATTVYGRGMGLAGGVVVVLLTDGIGRMAGRH